MEEVGGACVLYASTFADLLLSEREGEHTSSIIINILNELTYSMWLCYSLDRDVVYVFISFLHAYPFTTIFVAVELNEQVFTEKEEDGRRCFVISDTQQKNVIGSRIVCANLTIWLVSDEIIQNIAYL